MNCLSFSPTPYDKKPINYIEAAAPSSLAPRIAIILDAKPALVIGNQRGAGRQPVLRFPANWFRNATHT